MDDARSAAEVAALRARGAECARDGRWDEVALISERLVDFAATAEERQTWQARLAQVWNERLGKKDEAAKLYLELFAGGARSAEIVDALRRLAASGIRADDIREALEGPSTDVIDLRIRMQTESQDWSALAQTLESVWTSERHNPRGRDAAVQLAVLKDEKLSDTRGAIELCAQVLLQDPLHALARETLAARVEVPGIDGACALDVLDPLLAKEGREDERADLREARLQVAHGAEKARLVHQLVALREGPLEDPERALLTGLQAFAAGVDRDTLAPTLERLAEAVGSSEEIAELFESAADQLLPGDPSCAALLGRAARLRQKLGDAEGALRLWGEVLSERSGDPEALSAKAGLLLSNAAAKERAGDDDGAADGYRAAYALQPTAEPLLALDRLYKRTQRFAEQAEVLARLTQLGDQPADARVASLERAQLLVKACLPEAALSAYLHVLDRWPGEPQAISGLEALFRVESLRGEVARVLEPLYRAQGNPAALVEVLGVRVDAAPPAARAGLWREIATLREGLGQRAEAFAAWRRAFAEAPGDDEARAAFERVAERDGMLEELVAAYEELLERLEGPLALTLWRQVAALEEKLSRPTRAVAAWEEVARRQPGAPGALEALARLHATLRNPRAQVDALVRLDVPDALLEAAALARDTLCDHALAATCYQRVLHHVPDHAQALAALERLFSSDGRVDELKGVLDKEIRVAQAGGAADQVQSLHLRRAQLELEPGGDTLRALFDLQRVLALSPSNLDALAGLERIALSGAPGAADAARHLVPLLERSGDKVRLVTLLRAQAAATEDRAERVALFLRVSELCAGPLHEPAAAFLAVGEALRLDPESAPLLERAFELAGRAEAHEELSALLEELARAAQTAAARVRLLLKLARAQESFGQPEDAIEVWQRILKDVPGHAEALDRLEALLEANGQYDALAELFDRRLALAQSRDERLRVLKRLAAAQELGGQPGAAVETLHAALDLQPDVGILSTLQRLLGELGRHLEQADALWQLATLSPDAAARRRQLLLSGDAFVKGGRPDAAVDAFAQVVAADPSDAHALAGLERLLAAPSAKARAARALEPTVRASGDARRLAGVLDILLAEATAGERKALLLEIARLREALGEAPLAFASLLTCFAEDPADARVRGEAERLAAATQGYGELADEYRAQLERALTPGLKLELGRKLAALYGTVLSRPDLAIPAWKSVLEAAPDQPEALRALAQLYQVSGDYEALAQVLERQIRGQAQGPGRGELLLTLAQVTDERLGNKGRAIEACREALAAAPEQPDARAYLESLLEETGRQDELYEQLEERLAQAEAAGEEEASISLRVRMARSVATDPARALPMLRDVLRKRAGHEGAMEVLEEMMRPGAAQRAAAASLLEPIYEWRQDHARLVDALEARLTAESAPEGRVAVLHRIARLQAGPLWNPPAAFHASARALRELPDDARALEQCLAWHEVAGASGELIGTLGDVLAHVTNGPAALPLWTALAAVHQQQGHESDAIAAWQQVLAFAPSDGAALAALAKLLERRSRWPELLEVLRRQVAAAGTDRDRVMLLGRMCDVQESRLGDTAGALDNARALVDLLPKDAGALERLDHLSEAEGSWAELGDVLRRRIELAPADAREELELRLAELKQSRLGDRAGALALWAALLARNPRHPDALAPLEVIADEEPDAPEIIDVLLRAHRAARDHTRLAGLLERRAALEPDLAARQALRLELVDLREERGEPELAFIALSRAFAEAPEDGRVLARLEQLAEAEGIGEALGEVLERVVDGLPPGETAASLALRLAALHEALEGTEASVPWLEKALALHPPAEPKALTQLAEAFQRLERWDELAEAWERLLTLEPARLDVARALERLYARRDRPERRLRALEHVSSLTQGPERDEALLAAAELHASALGDPERAAVIYRGILEHNPQSLPAFERLSALLQSGGRHDELRALLLARLDWTFEPGEAAELHERLGLLLRDGLRDAQAAESHFKAAVDKEPRRESALQAWWTTSESLGHRDDLPDVLRRLAALRAGTDGVRAPLLRLAELLMGGDADKRGHALDAAREAFSQGARDAESLSRLLAVFTALDATTDAVQVLDLQADLATEAGDTAATVTALIAAADLRERAGRREELASTLERVLAAQPPHRPAYERLTPLLAELGLWTRYAAAVRGFVPHLSSDAERCAAWEALARAAEAHLKDPNAAQEGLAEAWRLSPDRDDLLTGMLRLADRTGARDAAAEVMAHVTDSLPKGPLAVRRYLALAEWFDAKLDAVADAQGALRQALAIQPESLEAFDRLAEMHLRRGSFSEYVSALNEKREVLRGTTERRNIDLEIARVQDELLQDPDAAAAALTRALELAPDAATARSLVDLCRRHGRWPEAVRALVLARDLAPSGTERLRVQVEIAAIQEAELGDDEAAIEAYQRVRELEPGHPDATEALERLYTRIRAWGDLLALYRDRLERETDSADRIALLFHCATLEEQHLGNAAAADSTLESLLHADPRNLLALRALVRLRRAAGRDGQRVAALGRLAQASPERAEQVATHVEMAEAFRDKLREPDRAIASYLQALELSPEERPLLRALTSLYEGKLEWARALDFLQREASLAAGDEAAALHQRAGETALEKLKDPNGAKDAYRKALALQPRNVAALRALATLYARERDWHGFEEMLGAEARFAPQPAERLAALLQLARHFAERKQDVAAAQKWYGEALRLDPESVEAAGPLAELAVGRKDWATAEPLLDLLARKATSQLDTARQLHRLAQASLELGKTERALASYRRASQLDPGSLAIHEGFAAALVQSQRFPEALETYQGILIRHAPQMGPAQAAALRCDVGHLHVQLGQWSQAKVHFERALALTPSHARALEGLVRVADELQDPRGAADFRRKRMRLLTGEERFKVACELGELARGPLGDAALSIEAYAEALKVKPGNPAVLDALWPLYRKAGQPDKALQTLQALLDHPEVQSAPERRKRLFLATGEVLAHDKRELAGGLEAFNAALDVDFRFTDALAAIESLLGSAKRWRQLDDQYGRMLTRVPETPDTLSLRMSLWKARGDLRARALHDAEGALAAYRTAAEGLPADAALQEALGDHAVSLGGHEATAVGAYRRALPGTANPARVCVALGELAAKMKDFDSAYLTTHALAELLGKAGQTERAVLDLLGPHARANEDAKHALTDRHWRELLYHPSISGPFAELMGILCEHASDVWAVSPSAYGVNAKKHRVDVRAAPTGTNLSHLQYVAALLGSGTVHVFSPHVFSPQESARSPDRADIELCWTAPPSVRLGAAFFRDAEVRELRARIAFALTLLRPDLALARALNVERLETLVQAALSVAGFELRVGTPADPKILKKERRGIERALSAPARAALDNVVRQYAAVVRPDDVRRYVRGAELTATRAALLAGAEAPAVLHAVTDRRGVLLAVTRDEAVRDLVTFAAGGNLHALRAAVGTSVDVAGNAAPAAPAGTAAGKRGIAQA